MKDDLDFFIVVGTGFILGMAIAMLMYNVMVAKVYESGSYITYKDKIYKEVPEEELDNLVIFRGE